MAARRACRRTSTRSDGSTGTGARFLVGCRRTVMSSGALSPSSSGTSSLTRDGMNAARRVAVDHKLAGEHPKRRRISLSQLGQKIGGSHGWLPTPLLPLPAHSPEKRMTDGNFGQISETCRTSGGVEKWNSMVPSRSQVQTSCAPASK